MLSSETKRKIDNARDILVGKIPTPTGQVEHITLALMYKFMNDMDTLSRELGGRAKFFTGDYRQYAWKNIMDPATSAHERVTLYSQGLEKMGTNPALPLLFREIFKRAFLPFRDPEVLTLFLKQIDGFAYDHSEELGNAFEYLLSIMGTQGEAGQLRTPRHIIDFIVKVVAPKKTDRILDPACGTAGFLISAFKHIMAENIKTGSNKSGSALTQAEKNNLPKNFVGYDISHDMVRISLVNLYLHEFPDPRIYEYDTLTSVAKWDDDFDCILANPPFMTPKGGIRPHRRFQIQANRSEVLFVDYIMEHLSTHGKAGVIVPEGIIFQSANAYKALRKMMVAQNYLWAVVSLPAGVFQPYSGVKTSILLMDKAIAKKTENILFVKIENDGFDLGAQRNKIDKDDLPGALEVLRGYKKCVVAGVEFKVGARHAVPLHVIAKSRIAEGGDYNLTGDRYREDIVFTHKDWPMVKIGELCELVGGGTPLKSNPDYWEQGTIKWISSKHIIGDCIFDSDQRITHRAVEESSTAVVPADTIILVTRVSLGKIAVAQDSFAINQDLTGLIIKNKNAVETAYLFNMLKSDIQHIVDAGQGLGVKGVTRDFVKRIKIPLPPLEVQREIVAELGGYQKIIDGAKQVIANYKPQIKIDSAWSTKPLQNICENLDSRRVPVTQSIRKEGIYPYYGASGIVDYVEGYLFDEDLLLVSEDGANLLARSTPIAFSVSGKIWVNNHAHVLRFKSMATQIFVEVYLNSISLEPFVTGAAQPKLNQDKLNNIPIPLPPLSTQKQIVAEIEEEQKLVEANKKLIEIFGRKIKNKIDEVWGRETPAETEGEILMAAEEPAEYGD